MHLHNKLHISTYFAVAVNLSVTVCMCACMHACIGTCMPASACVCVCMRACLCVCVCWSNFTSCCSKRLEIRCMHTCVCVIKTHKLLIPESTQQIKQPCTQPAPCFTFSSQALFTKSPNSQCMHGHYLKPGRVPGGVEVIGALQGSVLDLIGCLHAVDVGGELHLQELMILMPLHLTKHQAHQSSNVIKNKKQMNK